MRTQPIESTTKRKSDSLNEILETIDKFDMEKQEYVAEVLYKRIIDLKRTRIAHRIRNAVQNYKKGKTRQGQVGDLLKDLNG